MASSGKRRKTTWKDATKNDIIQISSGRMNWADEVEKEADDHNDAKPVVLPTAPRASCVVPIDETKIPNGPPFQAHVSNLPYELTESELVELFPELRIKEVRIPKEDRGNRAKGYGYVEFDDRESLFDALRMGEIYVKGRSVRIELATSDSGRGGGRSRGNQRGDMGSGSSSVDRTSGNWRSGPRDEMEEKGFDRGGSRRDFGPSGGFSRRDNSSDGFNDRRDVREERPSRRDDRNFREERPRYEDRRDDWGSRDSDRRYPPRRDERSDPPPERNTSSEPKNRPKLQLQPRSSNLPPPTVSTEPASSNSIFGNAKPVDTTAKLREIEERLAKSEIGEKSRSGGSSTGSSGGPPRSSTSDAKERKVEPGQPPRENPWNKSRLNHQGPQPVNNGRSGSSEPGEGRDDNKGNDPDSIKNI